MNRKEPQNVRNAETLPPWGGVVADPLKTSPLPMCYVKFGSSVTKGVCMDRKEPPKMASAEASRWSGSVLTP